MNPTIIALLLAYVVFPLLFVLMEKFWFSLPDRKILRAGFGSDVIWYGFQSFISQRLAPIVVYFVLGPVIFAYGMTTKEFFSGFGPVAQLPFWLQVPLVFVLADFLLYWHHTRIEDGGEKNFANYLPIWDLIFGTFLCLWIGCPARLALMILYRMASSANSPTRCFRYSAQPGNRMESLLTNP